MMRTRAMRRQAMPSCLPPQLIIAWLPTRDVAAALGVSKAWSAAPEPIFQAIAGRHGLRLALGSWRATVRRYRSYVGYFDFDSPTVYPHGQHPLRIHGAAQRNDVPSIQRYISEGVDINYGSSVGQTPQRRVVVCQLNLERLCLFMLGASRAPRPRRHG